MFAQLKLHSGLYTLRMMRRGDLPQARDLLARGEYVHNQLDWWPLDEWIDSPAGLVAVRGQRVVGLSLAVCDHSPVAWWRSLALEAEGYREAALPALLDSTRAGLKQLGAEALTCMAFSDWLENELPVLGFDLLTQVITLRKDDCCLPPLAQSGVTIRPASRDDVQAVLAVDRAAFDSTWHYGARGLRLMWAQMSHAVVAVQGRIIGYACGNRHGDMGHVVRLAVEPSSQGRGVGGHLLAAMVRAFYAAGLHAVTLNTQIDNAASQKLYRRFDFRPIGSPFSVWQAVV